MDTAPDKDDGYEIANAVFRTNLLFFWHKSKFSLREKKTNRSNTEYYLTVYSCGEVWNSPPSEINFIYRDLH